MKRLLPPTAPMPLMVSLTTTGWPDVISGFGLKAGIGYENLHEQVPPAWGNGDDQEMIQAGASYTFNNFSVGAQYESDDNYRPTPASTTKLGL